MMLWRASVASRISRRHAVILFGLWTLAGHTQAWLIGARKATPANGSNFLRHTRHSLETFF